MQQLWELLEQIIINKQMALFENIAVSCDLYEGQNTVHVHERPHDSISGGSWQPEILGFNRLRLFIVLVLKYSR
jgi:hypothetical protein